jgi:2-C-methyl-D-erythritol 4-phosphate cytidylyltransferase
MGGLQIPKQFLSVDEKPIMIHTLDYFQNHDEIDMIYIACVKEWIPHLNKLLEEHKITKVVKVVEGGETAQDSIYNALMAAKDANSSDSIVLIHDGVRPFITGRLISDIIACVREKGNAITCTPCYETIIISKQFDRVEQVPLRKDTYAAQAPQAFFLEDIIAVHDEIRKTNPTYDQMVDACTMYRFLEKDVHMVLGNIGNIKITKPEDVYILEALLQYRKSEEIMGLSFLDTFSDVVVEPEGDLR